MSDPYDIFISYAREDVGWVKEHLYEPLLQYRTAEGDRPRIFLDVSDEGIPVGRNWEDVIASALQRSRYILPVYSTVYFTKERCGWELALAHSLDPQGLGKLLPILAEADAAAAVPFKVSMTQFLDAGLPDWFERLTRRLELTADRVPPVLSLQTSPGDTIVNHTLAEVRVALLDGSTKAVLASDDPVTIRADGGKLEGTLTVAAEAGVATFRDLSFASPELEVRLVAEAPGCAPAVGAPLAVREPPVTRLDGTRRLASRGTMPVFFADGQTVAVVGAGTVEVFDPDGERVAEAELGRVRLTARSAGCLAFADWSGRVVVAHRDGRVRSARFASDGRVLAVPGGLCFAGEQAHAGFWDGAVWALSIDGHEPEQRLDHPAGVQSLQVAGDRYLIAGLDGKLAVYGPGAAIETYDLEPGVLALRAWPDSVVAVGEHAAFRLGLDSGVMVRDESLTPSRVASAFADSDLPLALDADGRGVRFDRQLTLRGTFHTTRGACVVDSDSAGRTVVFAYPDGSHAVMLADRVVFSTTGGGVAVSPDGRRIAFADRDAIVVSPAAEAFARADDDEAA